MNRIIVFITGFFFLTVLRAQAPFNFEELKKQYPEDFAVVLLDEAEMVFDLKKDQPYCTGTYKLQRVFLSDKVAAGNQASVYYNEHFTKLTSISGYTLIPSENGSYRKEEVKQFGESGKLDDNIFYDDSKYKLAQFTGVTKGAMTHFQYSYHFPDGHYLSPFFFKSGVPVIEARVRLKVSNNMKIAAKFFGDTTGLEINTEVKGGYTYYTYRLKNLPKMKTFERAATSRKYEPHVYFMINEIKTKDVWQPYTRTVADYYKLNYDYIKEALAVKLDEPLKRVTDSIIAASHDDDDEKIKGVFYWVQDHIKYVAFEDGLGGFVPRLANDIYEKKFGDCKDMASIISAMLRHANVAVYMCWIGTDMLPYTYEELPISACDNHMIAAVHRKGHWIFLDGTAKHLKYGIPSGFTQGKETLVSVNPDSFVVATVPVTPATENISSDSIFMWVENTKLKANAHSYVTGYPKSNIVERFYYTPSHKMEDEFKKLLSKGNNKAHVNSIAYSSYNIRDSGLVIHYQFEIDDYVKLIGDEMYVNLNLDKSFLDLRIDTAGRNYDMDMEYCFSDQYVAEFEIPSGYVIKKMPESRKFGFEKHSYEFTYESSGNKVRVKRRVLMEERYVSVKDFSKWNDMIDNLAKTYKELLVLVKK